MSKLWLTWCLFFDIVIGILALSTTSGRAQAEGLDTPQLNYSADVRFHYLDRWNRPATTNLMQSDGSANEEESGDDSGAEGVRTIGLKSLRVETIWAGFRRTELRLVFRPDASLSAHKNDNQSLPQEVDTRAGSAYRASGQLNLLDAYAVNAKLGSHVKLGMGVWESLAIRSYVRSATLDFGLRVRFPTRFSGLRLVWQQRSTPALAPADLSGSNFEHIFWLIQGDQDRAERVESSSDTFDKGPVAADPYYGGAVASSWTNDLGDGGATVALLLGTVDGSDLGGRRTEFFAEAYSQVAMPALFLSPIVEVDFRYAAEKWRETEISYGDLIQQSVSIGFSLALPRGTRVFTNVMVGRSDRHDQTDPSNKTPHNGSQFDFGISREFDQHLHLRFVLSQERREIETDSGDKQGAFLDAAEDSHSTLRRLGLEIFYHLNDNS